MFRKAYFKIYRAYREGEGGGEEITVKMTKDESGKVTFISNTGDRLLPQEHVDFLVGQARTKARDTAQAENQKLLDDLKKWRKDAEEKGQNVEALTTRIQELEDGKLTSEQLLEKRTADYEKTLNETKDSLSKEVESWRHRYTSEKIGTEIMNACVEAKAISAETIEPLIRGYTELVEDKNDQGEVTGMRTVVKFPLKDAEGNLVQEELSVADTVKKMREDVTRFGHLFAGEVKAGTGTRTLMDNSPNPGSTGQGFVFDGKGSQESYNKWAEQHMNQFGE